MFHSIMHWIPYFMQKNLYQFFQWIFRTDVIYDGLVGSPCSLRVSQVSSPTPQFKSIHYSTLGFVYSPTLISIHDCWKNHSFDWRHISCRFGALIFLSEICTVHILQVNLYPGFHKWKEQKSQFSILNNSLTSFPISNIENSLLHVGDFAYRFKYEQIWRIPYFRWKHLHLDGEIWDIWNTIFFSAISFFI